jgi:hypothetical protein
MHPPPPSPLDPGALKRLLRLRFLGRDALLDALLDAVVGHCDLSVLSAPEARRLQALLEGRSDAELERIARRGHPGRARMEFQFTVLLDGLPSASERELMGRRLLDLLRSHAWSAETVEVRSVVLGEVRIDADGEPTGC